MMIQDRAQEDPQARLFRLQRIAGLIGNDGWKAVQEHLEIEERNAYLALSQPGISKETVVAVTAILGKLYHLPERAIQEIQGLTKQGAVK